MGPVVGAVFCTVPLCTCLYLSTQWKREDVGQASEMAAAPPPSSVLPQASRATTTGDTADAICFARRVEPPAVVAHVGTQGGGVGGV